MIDPLVTLLLAYGPAVVGQTNKTVGVSSMTKEELNRLRAERDALVVLRQRCVNQVAKASVAYRDAYLEYADAKMNLSLTSDKLHDVCSEIDDMTELIEAEENPDGNN